MSCPPDVSTWFWAWEDLDTDSPQPHHYSKTRGAAITVRTRSAWILSKKRYWEHSEKKASREPLRVRNSNWILLIFQEKFTWKKERVYESPPHPYVPHPSSANWSSDNLDNVLAKALLESWLCFCVWWKCRKLDQDVLYSLAETSELVEDSAKRQHWLGALVLPPNAQVARIYSVVFGASWSDCSKQTL